MPGLVSIVGSNVSITGRASVTLDTRGCTAIYVFSYATFNADGIPPDGFDSEGNDWFQLGNPFSTCNGSTGSIRSFNPTTSQFHNFRMVGPTGSFGGFPFTVQMIVVAMKPTVILDDPHIQRRSDSSQPAPAHPGFFEDTTDNFAMITSCMAGCGLSTPSDPTNPLTVDSGFTIVENLPNIAVATNVLVTAGLVDVAWSGFTVNLDAPGGITTAGVIIEGFGIYITPPPSSGGTRIYEA